MIDFANLRPRQQVMLEEAKEVRPDGHGQVRLRSAEDVADAVFLESHGLGIVHDGYFIVNMAGVTATLLWPKVAA